jgi:hypothetical protein
VAIASPWRAGATPNHEQLRGDRLAESFIRPLEMQTSPLSPPGQSDRLLLLLAAGDSEQKWRLAVIGRQTAPRACLQK